MNRRDRDKRRPGVPMAVERRRRRQPRLHLCTGQVVPVCFGVKAGQGLLQAGRKAEWARVGGDGGAVLPGCSSCRRRMTCFRPLAATLDNCPERRLAAVKGSGLDAAFCRDEEQSQAARRSGRRQAMSPAQMEYHLTGGAVPLRPFCPFSSPVWRWERPGSSYPGATMDSSRTRCSGHWL